MAAAVALVGLAFRTPSVVRRAVIGTVNGSDMASAVFVHDHPFIVRSDGSIHSNKFPYQVWERYLGAFTTLTVVGRRRSTQSSEAVSSGPGVDFWLGANISTITGMLIGRRRLRRRLESLFAEHDAVIARLPSEYGGVAARVAHEMGKPYLLEVVGCPRDALWHYGGLRGKLYAPYSAFSMKQAVRRAQYVIYVSSAFLQSRYPANAHAKVAAISNVGIPERSRSILEERIGRYQAGAHLRTVGLIASLNASYKGVGDAIRAFKDIGIDGAMLRVLGDGNPERYLSLAAKLGVSDRVYFDGVRPSGEGVKDWLSEVDLYIQPSYTEGVPRALIEAMSVGCPAIGTTAGGIPELLDSDCMFSPGDIGALGTKIKHGLLDRAWARRQALRNFEKAGAYESSVLGARRLQILNAIREDCDSHAAC